MTTVGFRFHPNDHEIIYHYLTKKMNGRDFDDVIAEIDLCKYEPWELPGISIIEDDEEWYFFCRPNYKYKNSKRANRATKLGFWKPTGKVRSIKGKGSDSEIGTKKTLVFYSKQGGPRAVRTTWIIHEYQTKTILSHQREFFFCKLMDNSDDQTDRNSADEGEQNHGEVSGAEAQVSPAPISWVGEGLILQSQIDGFELDFDDSSADEGEQYHGEVSGAEAQVSPATMRWVDEVMQVDEELILQSQIDGFGLDFDDQSPEEMQAINMIHQVTHQYDSSGDEVDPLFVDSLLDEPEELVITTEVGRTLPNDYQPPRPLSAVYYENGCDMKSQVVHAESPQNVAIRQMRRVRTLNETLSHLNVDVDERRTARFVDENVLQINALTLGPPAEKPKGPRKTEVRESQRRPLGYKAQEVSFKGIQLQGQMLSGKSRNQVEVAALNHTGVKQGFDMESKKGRISAKIKSSESVGDVGKVSFIHMEAPSINRTSPRSVYVLNILVALVLSIFFIGWFFTEQL